MVETVQEWNGRIKRQSTEITTWAVSEDGGTQLRPSKSASQGIHAAYTTIGRIISELASRRAFIFCAQSNRCRSTKHRKSSLNHKESSLGGFGWEGVKLEGVFASFYFLDVGL